VTAHYEADCVSRDHCDRGATPQAQTTGSAVHSLSQSTSKRQSLNVSCAASSLPGSALPERDSSGPTLCSSRTVASRPCVRQLPTPPLSLRPAGCGHSHPALFTRDGNKNLGQFLHERGLLLQREH